LSPSMTTTSSQLYYDECTQYTYRGWITQQGDPYFQYTVRPYSNINNGHFFCYLIEVSYGEANLNHSNDSLFCFTINCSVNNFFENVDVTNLKFERVIIF